MYPTRTFEHLGESFTPSQSVADDHPMVLARPDLFTNNPPKSPKSKE